MLHKVTLVFTFLDLSEKVIVDRKFHFQPTGDSCLLSFSSLSISLPLLGFGYFELRFINLWHKSELELKFSFSAVVASIKYLMFNLT